MKNKKPKPYGNQNEIKSKINNFLTDIKKKVQNNGKNERSKSPNSKNLASKSQSPAQNKNTNLSEIIPPHKISETDMFNQSFGCDDKLKKSISQNEEKREKQSFISEKSASKTDNKSKNEDEDLSLYEEENQIDQIITNIRKKFFFFYD